MSHSKLKFVFSTMLHLLGIFVLFATFASFFISESTAAIIYSLVGDAQITEQILTPLVITLGLSTVVWGVGVFALRALSRPQVKTLTRAHGTIMTETLIVLPVFLLLTSGLAQMGINSMAGLLTTVGAFEAGRTVAVWAPEIGRDRVNAVTPELVRERARMAVALVVTPVARTLPQDILCSTSPIFDKTLAGLVSAGPFSPTAATGVNNRMWSFIDAFENQSFATRGPTKLKSAYCSVEVDANSFGGVPNSGTAGAMFTIAITYRHRPVFPLVSGIFGTSEIKRNYSMMSHLPPNDTLPY